jgi:type II secretory pathway component GspD/PulD (secretin)
MKSGITMLFLLVGIAYGSTNGGTYTQEELESALKRYERRTGTTCTTNPPAKDADLSLNMQNVPLQHAAHTFEGIAKKNILIDSDLTTHITIQPDTWITKQEALDLFAESLANHGLKLIALDDHTLKITKMTPTKPFTGHGKPCP